MSEPNDIFHNIPCRNAAGPWHMSCGGRNQLLMHTSILQPCVAAIADRDAVLFSPSGFLGLSTDVSAAVDVFSHSSAAARISSSNTPEVLSLVRGKPCVEYREFHPRIRSKSSVQSVDQKPIRSNPSFQKSPQRFGRPTPRRTLPPRWGAACVPLNAISAASVNGREMRSRSSCLRSSNAIQCATSG